MPDHLTYLLRLAAQWQAYAHWMIAAARCASRLQERRAVGAWQSAERLEVAARATHCEIMKDIWLAYDEFPPQTEDEEGPYRHLAAIAGAFLMIALFAKYLRFKLTGIDVAGFASTVWQSITTDPSEHSTHTGALLYIDPG